MPDRAEKERLIKISGCVCDSPILGLMRNTYNLIKLRAVFRLLNPKEKNINFIPLIKHLTKS